MQPWVSRIVYTLQARKKYFVAIDGGGMAWFKLRLEYAKGDLDSEK
jgi:hypothetical protein